MKYVYSIVRFVPDPTRGEFINVGAIVGSDQNSDWKVRRINNDKRVRYMDEHHTRDAAWDFLDSIGRDYALSEAKLEQLYVDHRNIVQLSMPIPMVASDAEEALDSIFEHKVFDPPVRLPQRKIQNRQTAKAAVRRVYQDNLIEAASLQEDVILEANHHEGPVDFAVTNGRVVQLTHAWSFRLADYKALATRVKSWGYTIGNIQNHGGRISTSDGQTFEVDKGVDIRAICVEPEPREQHPALEDAMQVFKDLKVPLTPADEADQIGQKALELLGSD